MENRKHSVPNFAHPQTDKYKYTYSYSTIRPPSTVTPTTIYMKLPDNIMIKIKQIL